MDDTEEGTSREEYIKALLADVVSLVCIKDDRILGRASGFVLQEPGTDKAYLVSVHHLYRTHKTGWHLECHVVNQSTGGLVIPAQSEAALLSIPISRRETPLVPLPTPILMPDAGKDDVPELDIAVFPLELKSTLATMTPELLEAGLRPDVPHFEPSCVVDLDKSEPYAFAAWNQDEHHTAIKAALRQPCYETDLEVVSIRKTLVVFRLNHDHPGHEFYYGASGAPIRDTAGRLAAMLIDGCPEQHTVRGVILSVVLPYLISG